MKGRNDRRGKGGGLSEKEKAEEKKNKGSVRNAWFPVLYALAAKVITSIQFSSIHLSTMRHRRVPM